MRRQHAGMGNVPLTPPPQPAINFYEEPGDLILTTSLTADQEKRRQVVQVDADADFLLVALCGTTYDEADDGDYELVLYTAAQKAVSSAYVRRQNFIGNVEFPTPLLVPLWYPAGSSIAVDLRELNGGTLTLQLRFMGIRRYRLS